MHPNCGTTYLRAPCSHFCLSKRKGAPAPRGKRSPMLLPNSVRGDFPAAAPVTLGRLALLPGGQKVPCHHPCFRQWKGGSPCYCLGVMPWEALCHCVPRSPVSLNPALGTICGEVYNAL
ncbi:SET and MYND domain-containing protein 5 [Platysternon megacephalum]|uniref:SET and MYND domain-containing protein 5 n=1 Tax=Platysternon megacephalum TaxID=55544 RepID=A0A4D9E885_9SAUR|nr:SET and MYND domain-containing protein 5 [Platysternon megacephalum]